MATFKINPERIGRGDAPEPFEVEADDDDRLADALAEGICQEAKKHLMSSDFTVSVNLDEMTFSVGAGRYGKGDIEEVVE